MSTYTPLVSVIVLTRDRLNLLQDAVRTLTEQEYPQERLEIIVVNDGSTDGTRAWLNQQAEQNERIRPVHQNARGIPAARNAGIRAARGQLIAIVADDYLLDPDYVATFVRFFQEHPEAHIVRFGMVPADRWPGSLFSHFYYKIGFRKRLYPHEWPNTASRRDKLRFYFSRLPDPPETLTTNHRLEAAGAAAFRREVFEQVGLFDEALQRTEDTDMSIRLREKGFEIWYYPHLKIRHRYGRWGVDTLKKSFESGIYAAHLHAKLAQDGSRQHRAGQHLGHRALSLIWRVRQASSWWKGLLFFPGILIFESAWQAGYVLGKLRIARASTHKPRSLVQGSSLPDDKGEGAPHPAMVFVVGTPRSGTTLLLTLLACHPNACPIPESYCFSGLTPTLGCEKGLPPLCRGAFPRYLSVRAARRFMAGMLTRRMPPNGHLEHLVDECEENGKTNARLLARRFFEGFAQNEHSIVIEKTPTHLYFIDEIRSVFPHAHIVQIVRDPRDVVSSFTEMLTNLGRPANNVYELGRAWKTGVETGMRHGIPMIRYEDLVRDPFPIVEKLYSDMGLEFNESWLAGQVEASDRTRHSDDSWNMGTRESVHAKRVGRHRHALTATERSIVEKVCRPHLERWGYIPCEPAPPRWTYYQCALTHPAMRFHSVAYRLWRNIRQRIRHSFK